MQGHSAGHQSGQEVSLFVIVYALPDLRSSAGGSGDYHWSFFEIGSNKDKALGTLYHSTWIMVEDFVVRTILNPETDKPAWKYERRSCSTAASPNSRIRVRVGTVMDFVRMEQVFEKVEVDAWRQEVRWNCLSWMEDAWRSLMMPDAVQVRNGLTWGNIEEAVMRLTKWAEREGFFENQQHGDTIPTWDLHDETRM